MKSKRYARLCARVLKGPHMPLDEKQSRLAEQIAREIRSLRIAGDEGTRLLRSDKIDVLSHRIAGDFLRSGTSYTLPQLSRQVSHYTTQYRDLRRTEEEARREKLTGVATKASPDDLRKLTPEQRLDRVNAEAYALAELRKKEAMT
jgi:hypothetical protein